MKYKDIDKSKKYADDRVKFLMHKEKYIMYTDYSNLSGDAFEECIDKVAEFGDTYETDGREILLVADFSNSKGNTRIVNKLKERTANSSVKRVKKTAIIGLTSVQKIFLHVFRSIGITDVMVFNDIERAKDWLVE